MAYPSIKDVFQQSTTRMGRSFLVVIPLLIGVKELNEQLDEAAVTLGKASGIGKTGLDLHKFPPCT